MCTDLAIAHRAHRRKVAGHIIVDRVFKVGGNVRSSLRNDGMLLLNDARNAQTVV